MKTIIEKGDYFETDDSYDYRHGHAIEDQDGETVFVRWSNGDKETIEVDGIDFVSAA